MATSTPNYGLIKPGINDLYGDFIPGIFATDMDTIDAELARLAEIAGVEITPIEATAISAENELQEAEKNGSD